MPRIECWIDYAELEQDLQLASRELAGILRTLTAWRTQFDREQAQAVGAKIAEWFHIDRSYGGAG